MCPSDQMRSPGCFWDCGEHHRGSLPASPHTLIKHQQPFPITPVPTLLQSIRQAVQGPGCGVSSEWLELLLWSDLDNRAGLLVSVKNISGPESCLWCPDFCQGLLIFLCCCCCLVSGFCLGFVGAGLLYFWYEKMDFTQITQSLFLYR